MERVQRKTLSELLQRFELELRSEKLTVQHILRILAIPDAELDGESIKYLESKVRFWEEELEECRRHMHIWQQALNSALTQSEWGDSTDDA